MCCCAGPDVMVDGKLDELSKGRPVSAFAARKAHPLEDTCKFKEPLVDSQKVGKADICRSSVRVRGQPRIKDPSKRQKAKLSFSPTKLRIDPRGHGRTDIRALDSDSPLSEPSESPIHAESLGVIPSLHFGEITEGGSVNIGNNSSGSETPRKEDTSAKVLSTFKPSKTNVFEDTPREWTICLEDGESLALLGIYDIWVRRGAVSILGAIIHASFRLHRVYAPSTHSLPTIRHSHNPYGPENQSAEITIVSCGTHIRYLRQLSTKFGRIWNHSSSSSPRSYQSTYAGKRSFCYLQTSSDDPHQRPLYIVESYPDWQVLISNLTESFGSQVKVVLVCGPKDSGKSTFSRLLMNALLSRPKRTSLPTGLAYLDLDPGQPEFSPPGEMSLLYLRSSLFSPPFTHPTVIRQGGDQVVKAHHLGAITPRDDPHHYIQCIWDLLQCYQQVLLEYPSCPLVVNCSGWVLGSGLEILTELLQNTNFTDVVYMSTDGPEEVVRELEQVAQEVQVAFHTLQSQPSRYATRTAADLRIMQALSYFHLDEDEESGLRWNASPLGFSKPLGLQYAGNDQAFLGIMVLGQELDLSCLADLVDGSILGVIAIDDNSALPTNVRVSSHVIDECEAIAVKEDGPHDTSATTDVTNHTSHEMQDLRDDERLSGSVSACQEISQNVSQPVLDHAWVRRTEDGLPYLFTGIGACMPLDPSKSHSLGQVLVLGVDKRNKVLRISTPIPSEVFNRCREDEVQVVLVRGKLDSPTWAYQEECVAALAKGRRRARGGYSEDRLEAETRAEEDVEFGSGLDIERWAKDKPWIRVSRRRKGKHLGEKVWKVRRNLQNRGPPLDGPRSE